MPSLEIKERQFDYGPQRDSWISLIPVGDVLEAAKVQLAYHERRLGVWKRRLAIASNKERGSMKAVTQNVTGGMQTMYQVDPLAAQQKQLAEQKVAIHERAVDEFREWRAALEFTVQGNRHAEPHKLPLTIADLRYFKLSHHTPTER